MTLTELLQHINILINKDTDYPTSSEEDYDVRVKLVNQAINVWGDDKGVLWNELFASLADASDGDTELVEDQESYDCPTDFNFPLGKVRTVHDDDSTYYDRMPVTQSQLLDDDSSTYCFWITGNKDAGHDIHIHPTPDSDNAGDTISYDYYKDPTELSSGTDVIEMSDPYFAVYWAAAELMQDELPSQADTYRQIALNKLSAMKLRNDQPAAWEAHAITDNYEGFGI